MIILLKYILYYTYNIIITNPIENSNIEDLKKNIEYRNKFFLNEIKQNPIYFTKLFIKKVIIMGILNPTLVRDMYSLDKSSEEANKNPKEYFHKNMNRNLLYSMMIYIFVLVKHLHNIVSNHHNILAL